uniref:Phenoloxidase-activating factor 2 n=1 Tax=Corethrella appendiculata TaxID=1370023 RepID=U5EDW0_9DIPT
MFSNILLFLFGLILVGVANTQNVNDDYIESFFTNNKPTVCGEGECVKLHLCENGTINEFGENLIDIRFDAEDPCNDYLLKCCPNSDIISDDVDIEAWLNQNTGNQQNVGNTGGGTGGLTGGIGGGRTGGTAGGTPGATTTSALHEWINQTPNPNNQTPNPNNNQNSNALPLNVGNGKPAPGNLVQADYGCGLRNVDGVGFRITGNKDHESEYGEFPWMVAILREEKALDEILNVYQCGGSIIHKSVVITGGHCVFEKSAHEIKVRAGEWDTQTRNERYDHQDRDVAEMVVHPKFHKGTLFNDIALLFLSEPLLLEETVQTVCLPPPNTNFDNTECTASGWGKDKFGKAGQYQVILKKINLPVVPRNQCQTSLRTTRLGPRFKLHDSFMCAGGVPEKDTCKGDGGSPLVCPIQGTINRYYQAGIVAWGIGCGEKGIPGVYADVSKLRIWIDEQMFKKSYGTDSYTLKN